MSKHLSTKEVQEMLRESQEAVLLSEPINAGTLSLKKGSKVKRFMHVVYETESSEIVFTVSSETKIEGEWAII